MPTVRFAATADIHAPRYLKLFESSLSKLDLDNIDLFLLAGDMVLHNDRRMVEKVVDVISKSYGGPIYACFGNEEYHGYEDEYRRIGRIVWLDDEPSTIESGRFKVGIVGSRGALDSPTNWQRRFKPDLEAVYADKPSKIAKLVSSLNTDLKIALTHYSPTYKTLKGEDPGIWVYLGSKAMEPVVASVDVWIHGHAHRGIVESVDIGGVPVYNLSLIH
ncbi:MAG: metallophosphoesterase, partial [Candidatus Bathyarchaeota archaeon]|nr:metallophosphoesterase [Candidatus Bathyarchaeota archaeon]